MPDESRDVPEESISIQSSIDIDNSDENESYDIYQRDKKKKARKRTIQSNKNEAPQKESDVIQRKNTTVKGNKRAAMPDSSDIGSNADKSTPAAKELGFGIGSSTQEHSTMKNAGDAMDNNSSEIQSKDKLSSIASQ